jgi:hypothetical protein
LRASCRSYLRGGFGSTLVGVDRWPRSLLLAFASLAYATAAAADPFWYERAVPERVPVPARYTSRLPAWFEPEPSFGTWQRHIDTILDGPTHLQWRLCRGDTAVQERVVDALRRSAAGSRDEYVETRSQMVVGAGCGSGTREEMRLRCEWLRNTVRSEPAGAVREIFFGHLLACAAAEDLTLFDSASAPDFAVIAFHRDHGPFGWSERLAGALRGRLARSEPIDDAVEALSRVDDPRVVDLLLGLRDETAEPEVKRVLALGLAGQSDPAAFEIYRREWRIQCEERRDAIQAGSLRRPLPALGYVHVDTRCDADALQRVPSPTREQRQPTVLAPPQPDDALRASLARFGLEEKVLSFSPDGAQAVGVHASLMRRLLDLVAPELDDLVLEETWPALDAFAFERGPEPGFTQLDRLGFKLGVRDERDVAGVTEELRAALTEPHWVDAYLDGSRLRFPLRPLGSRYDFETVVGALNQLLELRGSEQRFLLLASDREQPWPRVLAGPRDRLLAAIRAGVVRPAIEGPARSPGT